jgi:predicted lipoprotein with Yx(FWY)xxD motif
MRRHLILTFAALAGFAVALAAGIAGAKTFTLEVAKNGTVGGKHQAIAVTPSGRPVYWLSGDGPGHYKCTSANQCFSFWPPVKVHSAHGLTKAPGIKGKLGTVRRGGFLQLTLGGHPLYNFSADSKRNTANGNGLKTFGGTWHVVSVGAASSGSGGMTTTGTTTSTPTGTGTTGTTTCAYPPYCY